MCSPVKRTCAYTQPKPLVSTCFQTCLVLPSPHSSFPFDPSSISSLSLPFPIPKINLMIRRNDERRILCILKAEWQTDKDTINIQHYKLFHLGKTRSSNRANLKSLKSSGVRSHTPDRNRHLRPQPRHITLKNVSSKQNVPN